MTDGPLIFGESHVKRALSDVAFFTQFPEFTPLRIKMQAMKADLAAPTGGCSGCRKRRVVRNLYTEFMTILNALSPDTLGRVKKYFGVGQLLVNRPSNNPLQPTLVVI